MSLDVTPGTNVIPRRYNCSKFRPLEREGERETNRENDTLMNREQQKRRQVRKIERWREMYGCLCIYIVHAFYATVSERKSSEKERKT